MSVAKANATAVTFDAATGAWTDATQFRIFASDGTTEKTGLLGIKDATTGDPLTLEVDSGDVPQIPAGSLAVPVTGLDDDFAATLLDYGFVDGDLVALYDATDTELTGNGYAREAIDWADAVVS